MSEKKDDDDAVGYGKPPKRTRFKKGQSGNPKGRPKGHRNYTTDLDENIGQRVTIVENGKRRSVTLQQALLKKLAAKGLQGELRAIEQLLSQAAALSAERAAQSAERGLSGTEEDIVAQFRLAVLQAHQKETDND
jgi:hypothetical protein